MASRLEIEQNYTMLFYLFYGITLGLAAAVQPGPLLAYLISHTLSHGWRRTWPAIFSPLLSDGPIALISLLVISSLPGAWMSWLRIPGGMFILWLAYNAFQAWRNFDAALQSASSSGRNSLLKATVINLLNPSPYLGWSLVIGPVLLKGWSDNPFNGVTLLSGFYLTMLTTMFVMILLTQAARSVGAKVNRVLLGLSAIALSAFGVYQIWVGLSNL
jgi:threonine/homoserine/homoserine lactone efflux protein